MIAGVPTIYEALTRDPNFCRANLSCLKAAFSGGDALPAAVKGAFRTDGCGARWFGEAAGRVRAHRVGHRRDGDAHPRSREGSVGVPLPDMLVAIFRPGTDEELPVGEDGEICVHGPPVMLGYLDDPSATAEGAQGHRDGRTWLHTGTSGTGMQTASSISVGGSNG